MRLETWMGIISVVALSTGCSRVVTSPTDRVWLVGDSTVAPRSGWGDALANVLDPSAVAVENRARGGRSSKSFYEEEGSYWGDDDQAVLNHLAPNDFVLIQFGHNEAKPDLERQTEPGRGPDYDSTFRYYLESYVDETRDHGATPVLITPLSRMNFDAEGNHLRDHGAYPAAILRTAELNDVVVLDLEELSHLEFDAIGEAKTLELYAAGASDPTDRTHLAADKAWRVAAMVAELIAGSPLPLADLD